MSRKKNRNTQDAEPKKEILRTNDSFSNPIARLGYATENLLNATEYPLTRLTENYILLNSLYRNSWLVQNIITSVAEDMTKKWFKLRTAIDEKYLDKFERMTRQTHLRKAITEGIEWGRLYGGAVGLILIDGQDDLEKPLSLKEVMPDSFRGLLILDRWSGVYPFLDLVSDIRDPEFGLPDYYQVKFGGNDNSESIKVHHSRVVRFTGRELPNWERIATQYWGQSEIEAVYNEIVKRDNVSENIASLTFKANISVYEMDNLDQLFAVGGTQAQKRFWDLMQAQSVLESNMGVKLVNKGDNTRNQQYSFTGLPEVYESVMMDVAGATHIPVTKLFGRSPAGMNATGESDMRNYYDYIDQLRESKFRPVVEKLLPIMAVSCWGKIPDDLDIEFESMQTPTEQEKMQILSAKVQALSSVFAANGMTQEAFIKELQGLSEESGVFSNITDEMAEEGKGVWQNDLQQMQDPMAGMMGGMGAPDGGEEEGGGIPGMPGAEGGEKPEEAPEKPEPKNTHPESAEGESGKESPKEQKHTSEESPEERLKKALS